MDAQLAELDWMADHNFVGVYGPGYLKHAGDAAAVRRGTGTRSGPRAPSATSPSSCTRATARWSARRSPQVEKIYDDVVAAAGTNDLDAMLRHADAITDESLQFFFDFLNKNLDSRQPMWQMMLGGVFDRHPDLKLELTEIRLDWIPATLAHLDEIWERNRDQLPAKRRPSEYWKTNCLAGASFIHKVEVERRHELGVETILFGRDFPHQESTWPQTKDFLRATPSPGCPRTRCAPCSARTASASSGSTVTDWPRSPSASARPSRRSLGGGEVTEELIESFAARSGYLKPYEGDEKLAAVDKVLVDDLAAIGGTL